MNKKEQQIIDMMKALDISREEAEELVAFDNEEFELEEVNEMTEKAKKADKGTKRGRPAGTKMAGVTTQTRKKKVSLHTGNILRRSRLEFSSE